MSPSLLNNSSLSDMRLREEFSNQTTKHNLIPWEDQILHANKACEVWKSEANESNRKVNNKQTKLNTLLINPLSEYQFK